MASLPEVGDVIAGKYTLLRRIGEGGMGVVYEAMHLRLHQRLADQGAAAGRRREGRGPGPLRARGPDHRAASVHPIPLASSTSTT